MRTFEKSSKLDNVLYDVRGPVVDEAARMEEDGMEILKLNIGNPAPFGFSAPQEVILDMLSNIRSSQGYSDSKGIFSARKAIMQYSQDNYTLTGDFCDWVVSSDWVMSLLSDGSYSVRVTIDTPGDYYFRVMKNGRQGVGDLDAQFDEACTVDILFNPETEEMSYKIAGSSGT